MARAWEEHGQGLGGGAREEAQRATATEAPLLPRVPVPTPGRKLETTRSTPPSSSSHRSTFPKASWSSPSTHPFRKLWKGTWNLNIWSPGLPPPGGGGQASLLLLLFVQHLAKEDTYALPAPVTEYAPSSSAPSRVSVHGAHGAPAPADTHASSVPVTEYASSLSPTMAFAGPSPVIRFRGCSTCLLLRITSSSDHICRFLCGTRSCVRLSGAHNLPSPVLRKIQ